MHSQEQEQMPGVVSASGSKKSKKKKVRSIRIEKADNGGCVVTMDYESNPGGNYVEPDTFVFGAEDRDSALAHVGKYLGAEYAEEDEG